jgi:hypothetical protein
LAVEILKQPSALARSFAVFDAALSRDKIRLIEMQAGMKAY